jgi:hypothetical protein
MIHVKRWILFSFACVVVGITLCGPAIAGPTSARVPVSTEASRGMWPASVFGGQPRIEEAQPDALGRAFAPAPFLIAPRVLPFFWFGHSQLDQFGGCLRSAYAMTSDGWAPNESLADASLVGTPSLNPLGSGTPVDATDCFHQSYSHGSSSLGSPLSPGENKDALYGPMYHPDPYITQ